MKILQLYTDLRVGGIQRFVLDLAQELEKKHEVILLTTWNESIKLPLNDSVIKQK